jgi:uncharacterized protein
MALRWFLDREQYHARAGLVSDRGNCGLSATPKEDMPEMPYAILAKDKPGSAALRAELRPVHLEHLERHAAKLLAGGAVFADDGTTPVGSLIIFDSDDRGEVDRFMAADPFTQGGLFESVTVYPWRKAFLAGARAS